MLENRKENSLQTSFAFYNGEYQGGDIMVRSVNVKFSMEERQIGCL